MNAVEIPAEAPLVPVLPPLWGRALDFVRGQLALQKDRLFLWFPVFLGLGIAFYFSLPAEPPLALGLVLFLFTLAALLIAPTERKTSFLMIALIAGGFAASSLRTQLSYTPMLDRDIKVTSIEGRVETIEDMEDGKGSRVVLSDVKLEKLPPEQTPRKLRMTMKKDMGLSVGGHIKILGGLEPPAAPMWPGGFDIQRYMYFQQIGGMAFAYKPIEVLPPADGLHDFIERIRVAIDQRVTAELTYPDAGIALALITGRRAGISQQVNDEIKAAGLAHLLSISGLHIGLASGIVFFAVRFLMVCIPGFALRHPVKKYAAGFAFAAALFYTLLAGAPIPAQRSLIMVGIALLAIMLDRSPISLRLVAWAAFAVLVVAPDSLMSASFQMSFAAVTALIVAADLSRPLMVKLYRDAGPIKKFLLYFLVLGLTSVVASVATAPFTLFHFQQLTIYGVLSNAVAVPLSGFVIMPAAVLSLLLMPLGLEHWPLDVMGWGCRAIIDLSQWVAGLPHAMIKVPAMPNAVLPLFASAVALAGMVRGPLKWAAIVPFAAMVFFLMAYKQPDILIDPKFEIMAYYAGDGSLRVSTVRRAQYVREKWEGAYGLPEGSARAWPKEGRDGEIACDESACRIDLKGHHIAYLKTPAVMNEECGWADLIIAEDPAGHRGCPGVAVIDKIHVLRNGAYGIWLEKNGIRIETGQQARGRRPWSE